MSLQLSAPQARTNSHILDEFDCGEVVLDEWLKRRATANQLSGASRTFVVADQVGRVYGYYAMAAGAVTHQMATDAESFKVFFSCRMRSSAPWRFHRMPVLKRCLFTRCMSKPSASTNITDSKHHPCMR